MFNPPTTAQVFPTLLQDPRWRMVLQREPSNDFVYGVTTTGIFCRSTCPSRRPEPANVRFYNNGAQARSAGLRPCKRCQPEDDSLAPSAKTAGLVAKACAYLDLQSDRTVPLSKLAEHVGLSPFHLQKLFRATVGVTPRQYVHAQRMKHFAEQIEAHSITDALYQAGFQSSSRLYENAARDLGMHPGDLRRKAAGLEILYSIAACPLGRVLVATTEKGICAIALGDTDEELLADLQRRFAKADLVPADDQVALQQVIALIAEPQAALALPLDLRATAFQLRVWQQLQLIPRGETRSYAQVAVALGKPTAARAVARACASNPVALAIPCHRVVGSSGAITGYRWGVDRKEKLLAMEQAH
ncbi:transcriptional regulator, AraC family [Terriglobus saanensis SP1PR4]|uniref:methylated-DNA--[protein]-cysteine S-methyltransferase n=2 Tax=Terriglobus saanensis TaxID=870903 RepID=E8V5Z8_TERSS|nr:transcriptional regulator, AraC family [Terriglobus saanensis SP1PR4]